MHEPHQINKSGRKYCHILLIIGVRYGHDVAQTHAVKR